MLNEPRTAEGTPRGARDVDWSDGGLGVKAAQAFTGLSRTRLYEAMAAGELIWCNAGGAVRGKRLIARRSLVEFLGRATRRMT